MWLRSLLLWKALELGIFLGLPTESAVHLFPPPGCGGITDMFVFQTPVGNGLHAALWFVSDVRCGDAFSSRVADTRANALKGTEDGFPFLEGSSCRRGGGRCDAGRRRLAGER